MEPITIKPVPTPPKAPYVTPWTEQLVTYTKGNVAWLMFTCTLGGIALGRLIAFSQIAGL